jgi:hypothetical protein
LKNQNHQLVADRRELFGLRCIPETRSGVVGLGSHKHPWMFSSPSISK